MDNIHIVVSKHRPAVKHWTNFIGGVAARVLRAEASSTVRPDLVIGITALIFSGAEDRDQVVAQEADGNEGCGPLCKNCAVGDAEDVAVAALLGPTRPEILLGPAF
jgi:hypothetical protein